MNLVVLPTVAVSPAGTEALSPASTTKPPPPPPPSPHGSPPSPPPPPPPPPSSPPLPPHGPPQASARPSSGHVPSPAATSRFAEANPTTVRSDAIGWSASGCTTCQQTLGLRSLAQRYLCPAHSMYVASWWVRRRTALAGRLDGVFVACHKRCFSRAP